MSYSNDPPKMKTKLLGKCYGKKIAATEYALFLRPDKKIDKAGLRKYCQKHNLKKREIR